MKKPEASQLPAVILTYCAAAGMAMLVRMRNVASFIDFRYVPLVPQRLNLGNKRTVRCSACGLLSFAARSRRVRVGVETTTQLIQEIWVP